MIDFPTVFLSIVSLWWLLPVIFIILFFKSPFAKGLIGEALINLVINVRLDKNEYHLIKDVTLPTEDGTTQIDHIIVSKYGIFVIETKNMKGWIFGNEHQKTWTQSIYKHKSKFQNPLHQNYKHTKTIESNLGIDKEKLFSVVVFVGDSTFKTDMPDNVTYAGGLFRYINSKTKILMSQKEVDEIVLAIESGRLSRTIQTHREHVSHVKKQRQNNKSSFAKKSYVMTCPRCSNKLVLRVAKKGNNIGNEFYGCSNYPRCKYTKYKI